MVLDGTRVSPIWALIDQLWNHGDEVDALFAQKFGDAVKQQARLWDDTVAWSSSERMGVDMCIGEMTSGLDIVFANARKRDASTIDDPSKEEVERALDDIDTAYNLSTAGEIVAKLIVARDMWRKRAHMLAEVMKTPRIDDFIEALKVEAAYQADRFNFEDEQKDDAQWFWQSRPLQRPREATPQHRVGGRSLLQLVQAQDGDSIMARFWAWLATLLTLPVVSSACCECARPSPESDGLCAKCNDILDRTW
jgi:hypothetical protein